MDSERPREQPPVTDNRHQERKERTRRALLSAARQLVLERGHKKTSIKQITDHADVGLGTFYNYFATKQHVFEGVLGEIREAFRERLDAVRVPLKDPATLVAVTTGYALREAVENEEWHRFLARSGLPRDQVLMQSSKQRHADLDWGRQSGRFRIDDVAFTASLIEGMLRHVAWEMSVGRLGENALVDTMRTVMRMLGLPDVVAQALAQSPLPAVPVSARPALPPLPAERHEPLQPDLPEPATADVVRAHEAGSTQAT